MEVEITWRKTINNLTGVALHIARLVLWRVYGGIHLVQIHTASVEVI